MAETTHGLNRSATDTREDANGEREREREQEEREKEREREGGREKEMKKRTYRCTGAAYATAGRASIHDNGHGHECCASFGTYRGAGAFESRSYRGEDLRLARKHHGDSDRGTNHAIGRCRGDRTSTPRTAEFLNVRDIAESFPCTPERAPA